MKAISIAKNAHGWTLVELIVVMAIFIMVVGISGNAFNLIMKQSIMQSKTAESNIEGVIGLEVMRKDLASAGFGLPWSSVKYDEVDPSETIASIYNDAVATTMLPSAVSGGDNVDPRDPTKLLAGTDYLVIRSTAVGTTQAATRWSYMNYTSATKPNSVPPKTWQSENLNPTDLVTVVNMSMDKVTGAFSNNLIVDNNNNFSTTFNNLANFEPQTSKTDYYVYGVNSQDKNISSLRFPFNRADYYVRIPAATDTVKMPFRCAPNTGILFKAVVSQLSGTFDDSSGNSRGNELPLLDCVADMQVVYNTYVSSTGASGSSGTLPASASEILNELKSIQVYILTHEGGKDPNFTYPNQYIAVGPSSDGINTGTGRKYKLSDITDWQQYRWKVYQMTVNTTNLNNTLE